MVELRGPARACRGKSVEVVTRELWDAKPEAFDRVGFTILVG